MNPELQRLLTELPTVLNIEGDLSYRWFGIQRQIHKPDNVSVSEMPIDELLQSSIARVLYNNAYTTSGSEPIQDRSLSKIQAEVNLADCSASNHLETDWQPAVAVVHEKSDGSARIDIGGVIVRCEQSDWRVSSNGVFVRTGNEDRFSQPGAYFALGGHATNDNVVRLYWNLAPEHVALLVDVLTRVLPDARVPFSLKVFPGQRRCDSGVLYLSRDDWDVAINPVATAYEKVRPYMAREVPLLTAELAPGLGIADDPGRGESFGLTWMNAIASAVVAAHRADRFTSTQFPAYARELLDQQGLDTDEPHRFHRDSRYKRFDVAPLPISRCTRSVDPVVSAHEAIDLLSRQLCEAAIQSGDTSNWYPEVQEQAAYGMLDHTIYQGAMGIAIFLDEGGRLLDCERTSEVARNAARASLIGASNAAIDGSSGSLYTGSLGTVIAGLRIGRAHGDEDLVRRSELLADRIVGSVNDFDHDDLLGGRAGFILGALMLPRVLDESAFLTKAREVGETLLARGHRVGDEPGQAWVNSQSNDERPLLGLSHGTAGFALALAGLARATSDTRFMDAADKAIAHEDYWWDQTGSWPDFRGEGVFAGQAATHCSDMLAWCHGGAGVLVARSAMLDLGVGLRTDVSESAAEQVRANLDETMWVSTKGSLCHGLAGNADCLLYASGNEPDESVSRIAEQLAGRIAAGAHSTMSKGLMIGQAGLGHFLARSVDPTIPSVLQPAAPWLSIEQLDGSSEQ